MSNKEIETEKNSEKETSGTKENSTAKNILGTIAYIAGVCIFVFLILHFVGQRTVVNGNSMDTTLANGQNLVMDKLSYRFHDPKRYDIIIFPNQKKKECIRIILSGLSECQVKPSRLKMERSILTIKS